MRIRTIKPGFWRNRKLASLGIEAHDFAARIISAADDYGYFEADVALLASDLYPFEANPQRIVRRCLPELERIGFIEVRGGEYGVGRLPGWKEHQRISHPAASRLQPKFEELASSGNPPEDSGSLRSPSALKGKGKEEEGEREGNGEPEGAPTPEDALGEAWNTNTTAPLPRVTLPLSKTRTKHAAEALARRPLEEWRRVFARINTSSFLRGADGKWKADFDWAIRAEGGKPEPATKVLEGAYDRASPSRDAPTEYATGQVTL